MVKVSIIVPVFNSEEYLEKCVESLLEQTLDEIEIILVDDCSEDRSRKMIADYAEQYPDRIRPVYLEENIRQGGARNRGMAIATGEYIAFVDSDDFIEPEMCEVMYGAANGADMVGADYYIDRGNQQQLVKLDYGDRIMSLEDKERFVSSCGLFGSRIYRRAFLEENILTFPERVFYEDAYFNFLTALYAERLVKVDYAFYHYYQSPNSTVRNRNNPRQYERLMIPGMILRSCEERGIYQRYKELSDQKYISMQMSNICYTCLGQFDVPEEARLREIRDAILRDCPGYSRGKYYKQTVFQLRCYLRLTMLSPKLTVWLYTHGADRYIELLAVAISKFKRRK